MLDTAYHPVGRLALKPPLAERVRLAVNAVLLLLPYGRPLISRLRRQLLPEGGKPNRVFTLCVLSFLQV